MSARGGGRPRRPGLGLGLGPGLCALLCGGLLLRPPPAAGYVLVSPVSWAVSDEADEELHSASAEDALPALLEDSGSLWQRGFPAAAHEEDAPGAGGAGAAAARARPPPAPRGMFSYRREGGGPAARAAAAAAAATARSLAHASAGGCLATASALGKIQGLPFGSCLAVSDGPLSNSTGIPFFYMTAKDPVVADLMKNPLASLALPELEGEFCRKNIVDPEDPRCARLTLTGRVIAVSPAEVEFAKHAMFSRHPGMRKWPRQYEWFFMKMRIEHVWLQKWYGGVADISREEYFKATPRKA
ncbi:protein CREG2 [Perognathus longimembris pacificus]|uniref:protein CREG2 n=1 Tax=Perognathus longimembris pacificus TaxID=214514 RepID=UPI00201A08F8|nr:protein CREG2 [Perognathus longimembris pacificus]